MDDMVILVDKNDNELGVKEKLEAHVSGLLHRAVSVFIFNQNNELLLQKRAATKYHSSGLWTNTCCSHPKPNEKTKDAANRRLKEEMNLTSNLIFSHSFYYNVNLDNGLFEHELDHVFIGYTDEKPIINLDEASDWKYMNIEELNKDILVNSNAYSAWLKICLKDVLLKVNSHL